MTLTMGTSRKGTPNSGKSTYKFVFLSVWGVEAKGLRVSVAGPRVWDLGLGVGFRA